MQKTLLSSFLLLFISLFSLSLKAQTVNVTASGGLPAGTYGNLGAAFTAINTGVHQGNISITITASTLELSSANLDSSGNLLGSNYTSILVQPQAGTAVTVSGSVAGHLINLNGADRVVFNGINSGGASLTLSNTDAGAASSTIRFINDASNNVFMNLTVRGAGVHNTTTPASGTIFFSTGVATGNDGNRFQSCNIDGAGLSPILLFSSGTTTSSATQNSSDSLINCNIYDFFNTASASPIGVFLSAGNTGWVFTGNSFYQTVNRSTAAQGVHTSLTIFPTWTSDSHIVSGNFSGGTGPNATGSLTYTGSATNVVGYIGFNVQTGGAGNTVSNNTVQNVSVTYAGSAGSFGNAGFSGFIGGYNGTTTFTGNTVNNFSITNTNGAALGSGMVFNGRVTTAGTAVSPLFIVTNNNITNLTFNGGGAGSAQFYGIRLEASSSNSLGSGTTTISNPLFFVSGNTISNLSSTTGGASAWIRGIGSLGTNGTSSTVPLVPEAVIEKNTISGITCFSALANYATNTAVGIQWNGGTNATITDTTYIDSNTVFNLSSTNTADLANSVTGIISTNAAVIIERNKIYGLSNSSAGTTAVPIITGINVRGITATSNVRNNFVALGAGSTTNTNIFGILNNLTNTATLNAYHNSVHISGTSGTRNSIALYRGTENMTGTAVTTPMDVKNNLFINQRSGGTGKNYAIGSLGTAGWTSNYNNLVSSNAATMAIWGTTDMDLATYRTNSGGDANSKSVAVNFVNPATGDLHLTGASNGDINLAGINVGVTDDFDGQPRSAIYPYMGGDEAPITLPVNMISFSGQKKGSYNKLSWTTATEINNKGFELLRSADGVNFTSIAYVASKAVNGNSSINLTYSFDDIQPLKGKNYYRLKQVDKDGKYTLSNIVVLDGNKAEFVLNQNYPNPVKDVTTLTYELGTDSKVRLDLFGFDGRALGSVVNANQNAGFYTIQVNAKQMGLSAGNYIYKLTVVDAEGKSQTFTKQMIVQ